MRERMRLLVMLVSLCPAVALGAEPGRAAARQPPGILRQLDGALSQLAARVSPAVLQIVVSGYSAASEDGQANVPFVLRRHVVGSGVIVDPAGYIVTNAHVVQGAQPGSSSSA
jgi:serine protease Do